MRLPFELPTTQTGHLQLGGCDALELAREFGTPLYVVDVAAVRARCVRYRAALQALPGGGQAAYASKAFWVGGMARLVAEAGLWADVSSEGELGIALAAGLTPERLILHGNNKSPEELRAAVRLGVGHVVVDSPWELEQLEAVARDLGQRARILLRVTPDITAGGHRAIQTGHATSKFGIPLAGGQAEAAARRAAASPWLTLRGYHCHIGSQILELEPFVAAARTVAAFAVTLWERYGIACPTLDLGGGLGARYVAGQEPPPVEVLVSAIGQAVGEVFAASGRPQPFVVLEPGRSIVAEGGVTLYTVGASKRLPGGARIVAVDGGMTDNPRVALYQARYTVVLARAPYDDPVEPIQVVGRLCESGDIIVESALLPEARPGDVLAVLTTGAYHHSMASNYNGLPRPAVVAVHDGQARPWVRRETLADMTATDVVLGPVGLEAGRTSRGET